MSSVEHNGACNHGSSESKKNNNDKNSHMYEKKKKNKNCKNNNRRNPSRKVKLRVQNMCCPKEACILKSILEEAPGIVSVNVNVVGRIAFVKYEDKLIEATDILRLLNEAHLGVSIISKGDGNNVNKNADDRTRQLLYLRGFGIVVKGALFVGVVITHIKGNAIEKWVAAPVLFFGIILLLCRVFIDFQRCLIVNINLLMLIAVCGALALQQWMDACIIVYVYDIASFLEYHARYKVETYIGALMMTSPETAVIASTNKSVPVETVPIGTEIVITAGERIPLDGVVTAGKAAVDESSITGEALPIPKVKDDTVCSGTIVQSGFLKVCTTCDYESSTVYRIQQVVSEAQSKSSRTEEFLNTFAKFYTPCVLLVAMLVFCGPLILYRQSHMSSTEFRKWVIRAVTILMVACPCSIVMAAPIPSVCAIANAAKRGVLIRGGVHLENLAVPPDVFVFDKTGTLTMGRFEVLKEYAVNPAYAEEVIKLAASLEVKCSHPLSACIVQRYSGCLSGKMDESGKGMDLCEIDDFVSHDGMGLRGTVDGQVILVGNLRLMEQYDVVVEKVLRSLYQDWAVDGCTVILIAVDGKLQMLLGLADQCRPSSPIAIRGLQDLGIECVMLTGDNEGAAESIKYHTGLTYAQFGMKPEQKKEWICRTQSRPSTKSKWKKKNMKVAMVGDGVNDSPSLATADVGMAIGLSGSPIAVESAGISLMTHDLSVIVDMVQLSQFYKRVTWENIIMAVIIKLAFAFAAMAKSDLLWLAVLSDLLALILVILNGLRTLRWKSTRDEDKIDVTTSDRTPLMEKSSSRNIDIENYADLSRMYAGEQQSSFKWFYRLGEKF